VISVGNITCGGTGKTPTVEMIARDLLGLGRHPAILSRGYRSLPSASGLNDEYQLLQANLPDVPHYQGVDRFVIGSEAIRQGADALLLDDGFQHTRLHRDLDIVLIDAILPFGHGRVLPSGLLREPLEALAHADLLGITRADQVTRAQLSRVEAYLRARFPQVPRILLHTEVLEHRTLDGEVPPPDSLRGARVLAFCAIGNPEAFRRQLEAVGADVVDLVCFRDHHAYTERDLERLQLRARELAVDAVVMTQKDAVKLTPKDGRERWVFPRIAARVARGEDDYRSALQRGLSGVIDSPRKGPPRSEPPG
jgi:tetraacyldisaccharide 4'-kinase